jgi:glycosyltransferase involved in cell wall biosynthesis
LLPVSNDSFGADCLGFYLNTLKPEVFLVQSDTRMTAYIPQLLKQLPSKPVFVHYVVIDGSIFDIEGRDNKWPKNWSNIIKEANKVVTMTKYGEDILRNMGIEADTIYHGVDTTKFIPISEEHKRGIQKQIGIGENVFSFGGVFKNMQRKNPEKYLHAFKIFLESKELNQNDRDRCRLVLHTNPQPAQGGEYDLMEQADSCGLQVGKNVFFSNLQVPPEQMQLVYESMDVFLHLGTMEGFGLPIIEAMSCGLPCIGIDSCTMPELFGDTALLCETPKYKNGHKITYGSFNGVEAEIVDPWEVAKKMVQLYKSESLRKELGMKATERAIKTFDWSIINKQWADYMNDLVVKEADIPAEWAKFME